MVDFHKKIRFYVLRSLSAGLLHNSLISMGEYYQILTVLSQKYLSGGISPPNIDERKEA